MVELGQQPRTMRLWPTTIFVCKKRFLIQNSLCTNFTYVINCVLSLQSQLLPNNRQYGSYSHNGYSLYFPVTFPVRIELPPNLPGTYRSTSMFSLLRHQNTSILFLSWHYVRTCFMGTIRVIEIIPIIFNSSHHTPLVPSLLGVTLFIILT